MIVINRYDDDCENEYRNLRDNYKSIVDYLEENTEYIELVNFKRVKGLQPLTTYKIYERR